MKTTFTTMLGFAGIIILLLYPWHAFSQTLHINYNDRRPNNISLDIENIEPDEKYQLELYRVIGDVIYTKGVIISFPEKELNSASITEHQTLRLFWQAKPIEKNEIEPEIKKIIQANTDKPEQSENMRFFFVLRERGGEFLDIKYVRGAPFVRAHEPDIQGIKAIYYTPYFKPEPKKKLPGIVLLGGSEGGYANPGFAARLASEGYLVASVAYFGVEGVPNCLINIEINKLQDVIGSIQKHMEANDSPVTIIGISRGTDYAALFAKNFPKSVNGVVLVSMDTYIFGSVGSSCSNDELKNPPWLVNGKAASFIPSIRLNWLQRFLVKRHNRRMGGVDRIYEKK